MRTGTPHAQGTSRAAAVVALSAAAVVAAGPTAPAAVSASGPCALDPSGTTVTCSYRYMGQEQSFRVPAGVTSLDVLAVGGHGGYGFSGGVGGVAAVVETTVVVSAGMVLYVEVGGVGESMSGYTMPGAGGWNGGGDGGQGKVGHDSEDVKSGGAGGGGASDVRLVSQSNPGSLSSRFVVAAGGGGDSIAAGGAAGQAGAAWAGDSEAGQPGTQTKGGEGGKDYFCGYLKPAPSGTRGSGGDGLDWPFSGNGCSGAAGGGGGGGWFGGGGASNASGGGGGSSYAPNGTFSLAGHDEEPSITISFTLP